MSEIEKLYENAGIEPKNKCYYWDCPYSTGMPANDIPYAERNCQNCNNPNKAVYPPFTAEKQIELIKWISNNDKDKNKELTLYNSAHPYYYFGLHHEPAHSEDDMWGYGEGLGTTFEDGLAKLINDLWQDLTKEERKQIKGILE